MAHRSFAARRDDGARQRLGDGDPDTMVAIVTDFAVPAESRLVVCKANLDTTFVPMANDGTFEAAFNSEPQSVRAGVDRRGRDRGTLPDQQSHAPCDSAARPTTAFHHPNPPAVDTKSGAYDLPMKSDEPTAPHPRIRDYI
jgi:hypothetical protein